MEIVHCEWYLECVAYAARWAFAILKWKYIYYYGEQTHKNRNTQLAPAFISSFFFSRISGSIYRHWND